MGIDRLHNQIKNDARRQTSYFEWEMPHPNEQQPAAMLQNNQYQYDAVGFLYNYVCLQHTVMFDQGLYKNMTTKKMLMTLAKLKVQYINDQRILFPLTKEQKMIYKAFAVKQPV